MWKKAESTIRDILKDKKIDYQEELGEAAFYGPKIDFKVKDVIGRERQLSTVQFDFNLPERFDMVFTNDK
jgi:threonyl-tRNA synthetase